MLRLPRILFSILILIPTMEAYRALVIIPLPSKSHSILGHSLVKLIADAGNEVTYLTSFPQENSPPRVKEIVIFDGSDKKIWLDNLNLKMVMDRKVTLNNLKRFITTLNELNLKTLLNKEMQVLMNDPNKKFDVIIAEWLYSDIYAGLTTLFDCPLIWLSTLQQHWKLLHLIEDIPNPAYTADIISSNHPPFTFFQRVQELTFQLSGIALEYFYTSYLYNAQYESIIAPCIRKRGKIVPHFDEVRFNASLVLGNTHVSLGSTTNLPLNFIPIAGYHISKNTKPLTGDLKSLLDNATYGVIYFSLGSNLKSESFPDILKNSLLKMFGGLKQTVIWKFEGEVSSKPSNVQIIKWAPQNSILAHQNCILFITHGGFLSMIEAVHFGKPLIGIPVYGDQFNNVARTVDKGIAKKVDLSYNMADEIEAAIHEIVSNPSYTIRAKELSFIYFHRPVSPATELIHWVEHVVETRGALHLRSPALLVRWYQKLYLDLLLVVLVAMLILMRLVRCIWVLLIHSRKKQISSKKKKKY